MSIPYLDVTISITSECTCMEYDPEKGDYTEEPSKECFGCYSDDVENLKLSILEPWLASHNLGGNDSLIIECPALGWTYSAAYAIVDADAQEIINTMILNGDFRVVFTLKGSELSAIRYSHDEPTGTGTFTFREYKHPD
jgi:hypothetical protein